MKNLIVFDFLGTLAKMRPAKGLISSSSLEILAKDNALGIITGGQRSEVLNILEKTGLSQFFDQNLIISASDTPLRKPDPRLIEMIKSRGDFNIIIFVGDMIKDFKLAKSAGIPFVFVGKKKVGDAQLGYDTSEIEKVIAKLLLSGGKSV